MIKLSGFLLCLGLSACSLVPPAEEAPIVEGLPGLNSIADSLSRQGATAHKWMESDGVVTYARQGDIDWHRELELLISASVNHFRFRDNYRVSDTIVGQIRTVRFEAVTTSQEVRLLELRIREGSIVYAVVEKGRSNFFSESWQRMHWDGNTYGLEMRQRVAGLFRSERKLGGTIVTAGQWWRVAFNLFDNEVPIGLELDMDGKSLRFANSGERVTYRFNRMAGDTHVYESEHYSSSVFWIATSDTTASGRWVNARSDQSYAVTFQAQRGTPWRFHPGRPAGRALSGSHPFLFEPVPGKERDTLVLALNQSGHIVQGTILSPSGDYRYLEGAVRNDTLLLSAMDGTHLFLLRAAIGKDSLVGEFLSAPGTQKRWTAALYAPLPDMQANGLGMVSDAPVAFAFTDATGATVRSTDDRWAGKPMIISIMGTWCSNCLDEAVFLNEVQQAFGSSIGIVALNFELVSDSSAALSNINRFSDKLALKYPVLLGGTGVNKQRVKEALPFLADFRAYPTMILLNASHRAVFVYTGFSGPATGAAYDNMRRELWANFNALASGQAP